MRKCRGTMAHRRFSLDAIRTPVALPQTTTSYGNYTYKHASTRHLHHHNQLVFANVANIGYNFRGIVCNSSSHSSSMSPHLHARLCISFICRHENCEGGLAVVVCDALHRFEYEMLHSRRAVNHCDVATLQI